MLRRTIRLARTWWADTKAGRRAHEPVSMLDPFAFWPDQASALVERTATGMGAVAGYAFHTEFVPSSGGTIRFGIRLRNLTATRGRLALQILTIDDRARQRPIAPKVKEVSVAALEANGGVTEISVLGQYCYSYALLGSVTPDCDARADGIEISVQGGDSSKALEVRLNMARRQFLAAPGEGALKDHVVYRPATMEAPVSQMCTAPQMAEPIYAEWCRRMGGTPTRHRKQWEFVFIMRALEYYGALRDGSRGLGFGVGIEPLSSVFAAMGCEIMATDLPADDERAAVWDKTNQLGSHIERIHHPQLCDRDLFFEKVSFRTVDMNDIPSDLRDFDFTWSSCAYEHLGSIEKGLAFFENSLKCLRPGGIAVHTTELNLSSNDDTLDNRGTVIFRRRDFEALTRRLLDQGHEVIPITFDTGDTELDQVIDMPPYSDDAHLKLALLRWVTTSFGMIVRRGPDTATEGCMVEASVDAPHLVPSH